MAQVMGKVRLPAAGTAYDVACVRISVRDVTEADVPATTVASVDLPSARIPASGMDLPFALDVPFDPARTYMVRAHADRDGSGTVTPGDLVSTIAHMVDLAGIPPHVVVPVQPVGA